MEDLQLVQVKSFLLPFPLHPPHQSDSLQRQCRRLSSLVFGLPKGFSEVHHLQRWFNEASLANETTSSTLFCIKHSAVKASVSCDNFDSLRESLCALLPVGDMPGPNIAEHCGRWALPPQAKTVRCHDFCWKLLLVLIIKPHALILDCIIQSNEIFFYITQRKKNHLKIDYLLSTERCKNTNQQFQEKYKKKTTSKGLQEIKTSIPVKRFEKCSCLSARWIEQILQQNLPTYFHTAVGKTILVTTFKIDNGFSTVVCPCVSVTNALRDNSFGWGKWTRVGTGWFASTITSLLCRQHACAR